MSRRSPLALGFAALLTVILVGCGSSTSTPTPAVTLSPTAAPTAPASGATESGAPSSTSPSDTSSPGGSGQPTAAPTLPPAAAPGTPTAPPFATDANLESLLPDTFQNVTLVKQSISGPTLATGGNDQSTQDIFDALKALGKTPNDLSFAVANDPAGKLAVLFGAYRVKGVDASAWLPKMIEIAGRQSKSTATRISLGGKDVTKLVPANGHQPSYLWPSRDVVFIVISNDEAVAGEAVAALH